jgi:hypothetical protein
MCRMDPYAPIAGISIERYAELGAELDGIDDPAAQIQKVGELGVSAADWEAAKAGWLARMQDMSLMGQVATRYMQLYNAALAQKKGTASVGFEEFCAMSAAIQVFGVEGMMNHYGISQGDWTTISAHWLNELSRDPMNLAVRRNQLQEQEAQRLRAGGQPREVKIDRSGAGAPVAGGASAFDPAAQGAMQMQAAQAQNQQWMAYSAGVMNSGMVQAGMKMAGAMNMMGGGSALMPGRAVMVQWSDGNQYPATLMQNNGAQCQVVFPNGENMWVETRFLTPA